MTIVRRSLLAVGLGGALAGLGFSSVYHVQTIIAAIIAAAAIPVAVAAARDRWSSVAPWRLPVVLVLLLVATLMTVIGGGAPGEPFASSALTGIVHGWRRTLDQDVAVRATLDTAGWLPMLVGAVTFIACEIEDRWSRTWALAPSALLLALSQTFKPLPVEWAATVGVSFALVILVAVAGPGMLRDRPVAPLEGTATAGVPATPRRRSRPRVAGVAFAALVALGAVTAVNAEPGPRAPRHTTPEAILSPLDLVPTLLKHSDTPLFDIRPNAGVVGDRWRLAVVDDFDGVSWRVSARYGPIGPVPLRAAATDDRTERGVAAVRMRSPLLYPWLPTGGTPTGVDGSEVAADANTGTLVAAPSRNGSRTEAYRVAFVTPVPTAPLATYPVARLNPPQPSGVPIELRELALSIVGNGRLDLSAVQALETYLQASYVLVSSGPIPGGHSVKNIVDFLTQSRRGTSEQFATAFALLARSIQIPVRIAVGVRVPSNPDADGKVTVHGRDVVAWPEVQFDRVGWVPFDAAPPTSGGDVRPASALDRARALAKQRRAVAPPSSAPVSPGTQTEAPPVVAASSKTRDHVVSPWWVATAVASLLMAGGVASPVILKARRRRRRRGQPDPADAVCGAWRDTLDVLRDYRVLSVGPTAPRQVLVALSDPSLETVRRHVAAFIQPLDDALWGTVAVPTNISDAAWRGADAIREDLGSQGFAPMLRAAVSRRASTYRRAETPSSSPRHGAGSRRSPLRAR